MTIEDFEVLAEARFGYCFELLRGKKQDKYARDNDRLRHFKVTGRIKNETPERSLWGMWSKQIASLLDIIEDLEKNPPILPSQEILDELISDNSNYPVLLEGLLVERMDRTIHNIIVGYETLDHVDIHKIPTQKRKK